MSQATIVVVTACPLAGGQDSVHKTNPRGLGHWCYTVICDSGILTHINSSKPGNDITELGPVGGMP